jgi:lysophospholipase L1-like esterase
MIKKSGLPFFLCTTIVCLSISFLPPSSLVAKEIIVAIGDSITQADTHWTVQGHKNTIQGGWVTRLGNLLEKDFPDEYEVVNKGINGDTALGVLRRLDRDVILLQPDIVIIAIGTNDIFAKLNAVPNTTTDYYQTTMTRIFNKLQLDLPNTPVFVMGMTTVLRKYAHMRFGNFLPPQEDLQTIFIDYNNVLKELAQNFQHFYVDIPSQWQKDVEESWRLYADGIHPNDAGYNLMAEILYDTLRSTVLHPRQKNATRNSVMP